MPSGDKSRFAPVRSAQAADVPNVAALYAKHFAAPRTVDDWYRVIGRAVELDAEITSLYVTHQLSDSQTVRPLAGFLLARRVVDEAEILAFAVAPACRNQGVGGRLLNHLIAELSYELPCRLFLEVSVENTPALALYAKSGFINVGMRKEYYASSGRAPVDAKVLALDLDNPSNSAGRSSLQC